MLASNVLKLPSGLKADVHRAGKGPPLVWLHGPHGVRRTDPMVAALAQHYSVVAPVAPGFNDLEELDDIRDIHDLALHYDDLLEVLGLDRVTLVGHSFGAMIAAEIAAHVPKRVEQLVLLSPFGLWRDDKPVADLFSGPYQAIDAVLWRDGKAGGPMADPSNLPNDPVEQAVVVLNAAASVAKFIWPLPDKGLRRRLHRVSARTLVVFGADDAIIPAAYAEEFAGAIKGARQSIVANAAHMAPYEQTDEVLALIRRHLGS